MLAFWQKLKGRQTRGKLLVKKKKGKSSGVPWLEASGSYGQAGWRGARHPWLGGVYLASVLGNKSEAWTNIREAVSFFIKSWTFGADCYRRCCLASQIVTRNSSLQVWQPGFRGCVLQVQGLFPGQVVTGLGVTVLLLYMTWPWSIGIFGLLLGS